MLSQTVRTLINSRLEVGMREYETRFPESEVLLFQPDRNEFDLFFSNIFSFRSRRRVVELAYDATRRNLRARRKILAPMLAAYGITLREDILDEPRDIWTERGIGSVQRAGSGHEPVLDRAGPAGGGGDERNAGRVRRAGERGAGVAGGPTGAT